jgi:hypothetical protein
MEFAMTKSDRDNVGLLLEDILRQEEARVSRDNNGGKEETMRISGVI